MSPETIEGSLERDLTRLSDNELEEKASQAEAKGKTEVAEGYRKEIARRKQEGSNKAA